MVVFSPFDNAMSDNFRNINVPCPDNPITLGDSNIFKFNKLLLLDIIFLS